jgi:hypothetical protein
MTDTAIGLAGIVALFALFILRMPVGLSMLTAGFLGTVAIRGWTHALPSLSSETFAIASFYQLTAISTMPPMPGSVISAAGLRRRRSSPAPSSPRCAAQPPPPPSPWGASRCPR